MSFVSEVPSAHAWLCPPRSEFPPAHCLPSGSQVLSGLLLPSSAPLLPPLSAWGGDWVVWWDGGRPASRHGSQLPAGAEGWVRGRSGSESCFAASQGGTRRCHPSPCRQCQGVVGGGHLPAPDSCNKFTRCRGYNLGVSYPPWIGVMGLRGGEVHTPGPNLGAALSFRTGPRQLWS